MKDYGFTRPSIDSTHFVLGAVQSLDKNILQPDGQWDAFLPTYEPQFENGFDTYGCTVWGTQNALETLYKRLYGVEINADERYTYNCAELLPPGGDPHQVAESIRKQGLTFGLLLTTPTLEDFCLPRPMTDEYLRIGKKWLSKHTVGHEWVIYGDRSKKERVQLMKEALTYSPLGASVSAWYDVDGLYEDRGQLNNHWCMIYGYMEADGETYFKVFDSYDHSLKLLHCDHEISFVKRYSLSLVGDGVDIKPTLIDELREIIKKIWNALNIF